MKKLFSLFWLCGGLLLGLVACNRFEDDVVPLRMSSLGPLQNDYFYVLDSESVRLNVLDNDSIQVSGSLTFGNPVAGSITSDSAGFVYRPSQQPLIGGMDKFYYKYCTNTSCDSAMVYVFVRNYCNLIPKADFATTPVDEPVIVPILANDDLCGQYTVTVSNWPTGQPANGTAILLADNTLQYTPNSGFVGIDSVSYNTFNGQLKRATVWISVGGAPCSIQANDVFVIAYQYTGQNFWPTLIGPLKNDMVCGPVTMKVIVPPAHGAVGKDPERQNFLFYAPAPGYIGPDSFQYQICNAAGECSMATVNLSVQVY